MSEIRFFFDRCCPAKLASLIKSYEDISPVHYFDDDARFEKDTPDVVWIKTLAEDGLWAVISMDGKILKKAHEREAIRDSGLPFFLLGDSWMHVPMHEKCWKLVKYWPTIVRAVKETKHRIYELSLSTGKLEAK